MEKLLRIARWSAAILFLLTVFYLLFSTQMILVAHERFTDLANMFGVLVGSAVAVGGAFFLWHIQQVSAARRLGPAIASLFRPMQKSLQTLMHGLEAPLGSGQGLNRGVGDELLKAERMLVGSQILVTRTWGVAPQLSAKQVEALVQIEGKTDSAQVLVRRFTSYWNNGQLVGPIEAEFPDLRAQLNCITTAIERLNARVSMFRKLAGQQVGFRRIFILRGSVSQPLSSSNSGQKDGSRDARGFA